MAANKQDSDDDGRIERINSAVEILRNYSPQTSDDWVAIALALADGYLRGDEPADSSNKEIEYDRFYGFRDVQIPNHPLIKSFHNLAFKSWVSKSKNSYAKVYRLGQIASRESTAKTNARRATKGRKLIGSASRERIRKAAENFQHLPKSTAAPEIAKVVSLSPDRVRILLSELFPGAEWGKKN